MIVPEALFQTCRLARLVALETCKRGVEAVKMGEWQSEEVRRLEETVVGVFKEEAIKSLDELLRIWYGVGEVEEVDGRVRGCGVGGFIFGVCGCISHLD